MKSFFVAVLCISLALGYALPIESEAKNTLESVDVAAFGDLNAGHERLARGYGGFGYPGYGGGFGGGYPGGFGGGYYPRSYGGGFGRASASASASAGSGFYGR